LKNDGLWSKRTPCQHELLTPGRSWADGTPGLRLFPHPNACCWPPLVLILWLKYIKRVMTKICLSLIVIMLIIAASISYK